MNSEKDIGELCEIKYIYFNLVIFNFLYSKIPIN